MAFVLMGDSWRPSHPPSSGAFILSSLFALLFADHYCATSTGTTFVSSCQQWCQLGMGENHKLWGGNTWHRSSALPQIPWKGTPSVLLCHLILIFISVANFLFFIFLQHTGQLVCSLLTSERLWECFGTFRSNTLKLLNCWHSRSSRI